MFTLCFDLVLLITGVICTNTNTRGYDSTIVSIEPSVLQSLFNLELSSITNQKNNKDAFILHNFQRILIPVHLTSDHGKSIMTEAAKYNEEQLSKNHPDFCLTLWISVLPFVHFSTNMQPVLDSIRIANRIYNGTVSTVILSPRFQGASQLALSLQQNILNIKKDEVGRFLRVGVQFKKLYCLEHPELIKFLNYSQIDIIIFATQYAVPASSRKYVFSEIVSGFPCHKLVNNRVKSAIYLPLIIQIEDNGQIISEETLVDLRNFSHAHDGQQVAVIIWANFVQGDETAIANTNASKTREFERWIEQPTKISKFHFGIAVNINNVPTNITNSVELISSVFSKVLVKLTTSVELNAMAIDNLIEIRQRHNQTILLESSLLVKMSNNTDSKENQKLVTDALDLANSANNVSTGAVGAVVIEWMHCLGTTRYVNYSDAVATTNFLEHCRQCIQSLFILRILRDRQSSSEDCKAGNETKVGIAVPLQILDMIFSFFTTRRYNAYPLLVLLNAADILVLQVFVGRGNILANGAEAYSREIINHMRQCRTVAGNLPRSSRPEFRFYVKLTGCTGGRSNLTERVEYARLLEILNNWAVTENVTILIDTAFQFVDEVCTVSAGGSLKNQCLCGWWEVSHNFRGERNSGFKIIDKKSVARELYERQKQQPSIKHIPKHEANMYLNVIIPSTAILTAIIAVTTASIVYHKRSKYMLSQREVKQLMRMLGGNVEAQYTSPNSLGVVESCHIYLEEYKLSRSQFEIESTRCLGSGKFGSVHVGNIKRNRKTSPVAIKTVNNSGAERSHGYYLKLKGLMSEIKILAYIGQHENIVGLLGSCTTELRKGKLFLCLEYCQLGCLRDHLRSCRPETTLNRDETEIDESTRSRPETDRHVVIFQNLHKWTKEIACGMEYIASKNIVHADLAARNVLLTLGMCAKICDVGLSRRLYEYTEYLKTEPGPLPWRWMAPESLVRQTYNEKSDIWSFGITMWEIFNFGDEPYAERSWDSDFLVLLEQGMCLDEPKYCGMELYFIMKKCWDLGPSNRPTFTELRILLGQINC